MELTARVVQSLGVTSGVSKSTGNPWQKGELLVETEGQYPKKIALSNMKSAEEFARLPIGALVKFGIDIESRTFNGKWYTNVNAYSFEIQGQQPPQQQVQYSQNYQSQQGVAPQPPQSQQGYQQQPPQQQFPTEEDIPF